MLKGKHWIILILLALVIPALAAPVNIVTNSGMKDRDNDHLPDGWVGESLDEKDRVVCHNQCWMRFSSAPGLRTLKQRIVVDIPEKTDLVLKFTPHGSEIPYNADIELDLYSNGEIVERFITPLQHKNTKQSTIVRFSHSGDEVEVRVDTPGGVEWKIRAVKFKV